MILLLFSKMHWLASLSFLLTHFICFLCDFAPPPCAQMPHTPGSHMLCILASCQTLVLSWQWWSMCDLEGHMEVSLFVSPVSTQMFLLGPGERSTDSCHHHFFYRCIRLLQPHVSLPGIFGIFLFPILENPSSETRILDKWSTDARMSLIFSALVHLHIL